MYYVDLPWYAFVIWAAFALLVLLPWLAIPIIGLAAVVRGLVLSRRSVATSPAGIRIPAEHLGLTMADGGEKVKKDSPTEEKKLSHSTYSFASE